MVKQPTQEVPVGDGAASAQQRKRPSRNILLAPILACATLLPALVIMYGSEKAGLALFCVLVTGFLVLIAYQIRGLSWRSATSAKNAAQRLGVLRSLIESPAAPKTAAMRESRPSEPKEAAPVTEPAAAPSTKPSKVDRREVRGRQAGQTHSSLPREELFTRAYNRIDAGLRSTDGRIAVLSAPGAPSRRAVALVPGFSGTKMAKSSVDVLFIDERAFTAGPWQGADRAEGAGMQAELHALCALARARGTLIIGRRSSVFGPGIRSIRKGYDAVFPEDFAKEALEGAPWPKQIHALAELAAIELPVDEVYTP